MAIFNSPNHVNYFLRRLKKKKLCFDPFPTSVPAHMAPFSKNFNLRDHQKISYECRDYESVDEKSLSLTVYARSIFT